MPTTIPTLPEYGKPKPPAGIPVLQNHKSQGPLVSLTKKLFNSKKLTQMPKLKSKKVPDPFKKRKRTRIV